MITFIGDHETAKLLGDQKVKIYLTREGALRYRTTNNFIYNNYEYGLIEYVTKGAFTIQWYDRSSKSIGGETHLYGFELLYYLSEKLNSIPSIESIIINLEKLEKKYV